MANEPVLGTLAGLRDSLVEDKRDVEHDVEQNGTDDQPSNFNTALLVPNPGSEDVEGVGCEQDHELVGEFLPVAEQ